LITFWLIPIYRIVHFHPLATPIDFYLLSFPTRRSSDLVTTYADLLEKSVVYGQNGQNEGYWYTFKYTGDMAFASVTDAVTGQVEDRKSTRLNSSHVSSSYAVFCLKKKKYNRLTMLPSDL